MTLNSAEWFSNQAVLAVTIDAQSVFNEVGALGWLTNSIFVALIVVGLILFMARAATKDVKLVPSGMREVDEAAVCSDLLCRTRRRGCAASRRTAVEQTHAEECGRRTGGVRQATAAAFT